MGKKDGHDNLIPLPQRTKEAQRAIRSKGGKISAERRRAKKTMRALLELAFEQIVTNSTTGETKTRKELSMARLAAQCANGDLKAIELAAKLMGEFTERHELTGADGQPIQLQPTPPKKLTAKEMRVALEELREDL